MKSQRTQRAEFGRRAWAYVLDMVFAMIPALVLLGLFGLNGGPGGEVVVDGLIVPQGPNLDPLIAPLYFLWHVFCALCVVLGLLESVTCFSLGKMVLRLEVRDQSGRPPELLILAARAGLKLSPFICFTLAWLTGWAYFDLAGLGLWFLFFVGCFTALSFTRTALHDMVVGTSVFE